MLGPPDTTVVHDPGLICRQRLLHRSASLLQRLISTQFTRELEFESRYRRYIAEYGEADSDIYVSTYSKSGTTWTQIILYQLTTSGDMDFDHLFDISPWLWYAAQRRVAAVEPPAPRLLKSHDDYRRFKKGRRGRFIFVIRDGRDVCLSLYHHRRNFKRYQGTFEEHFDDFLHGTSYNWFDHLRPWLQNRFGLDMHVVKFEDLKRDFDSTVRRLADFCALDVDPATLRRTHENCSFAAMKQHEAQLGPRNSHFEGRSDAPYLVKNADQFIRRGEIGEGRAMLSAAQLSAYRKRFDRSLGEFEVMADYR